MTSPAPAPNVNPGVFSWTSRSSHLDNLRGDAAKCHGGAEELAWDCAMSDNTRPPWPLRRAPRRDDVLPPPGDFNNPQPSDAPAAEETAARAALLALRNGLGPWLAEAAMTSTAPVKWRTMIRALYQAAAMCVLVDNDPIVVHTPPEITILPHTPEPQGDACMRCGLAVVDVVHPRALDSQEHQPEEGER
ncbi:hypothetical protein H4W33_006572 [Kibdelosporangium phytohabitans]|nr:hypothetical protein [Kibdelosporangium phytohabitans]